MGVNVQLESFSPAATQMTEEVLPTGIPIRREQEFPPQLGDNMLSEC